MILGAALLFLAADLNGIWVGYTVNPKNNARTEVSLKLTVDATGKIGGKLYGDYKSTPVVEGSVTGETVEFVALASEQAGNQINESRVRFTGKFINDNELELSRERISVSNAGNAGNSATTATPSPKQTVKLTRLL